MRNRLLSLLMVLAVLLFVRCSKGGNDTIILLGEESYYKEYVYQQILDAIPDSINMSEIFGNDAFKPDDIPEGCVPPNIEGDYYINPNIREYSNYPAYDPHCQVSDCYLHFGKQHNAVSNLALIQCDSVNYPQYISPLFSDTIYVKGYDNKFTAYYIVDHLDKQYNIIYTKGVIITGIMDNKYGVRGINNFSRIEVIIRSNDNNGIALPNGTIIRYIDNDNFVYVKQWYKDGMFN